MAKKKNIKTNNNNFKPAKKTNTVRKPVQEHYTKTFKSLDHFLDELYDLPGYIGDNIRTIEKSELSLKTLQEVLLNMIQYNTPDIEGETNEERNQFWSISISFDRCVIKTGHFIQLGWMCEKEYNKETGKYNILSITSNIISYNRDKTEDVCSYLEDAMWQIK